MSGILGIFNRSGAPVDRDLLEEMTQSMAYRGPDGQEVWRNGAIGFGHTLLRTTWESERERQPCTQPCTLDGQVWITADARVDARGELTGKLEAAGRRGVQEASDAELILHAYHVWGEACAEHLLGDFAFLIWDGRRRVLFGARDPFGAKPFYYAEAGRTLLCGNTLNCLRLHPEVSDDLNDLAVADFLLFDSNQDVSATYFAGIRRLPGGHCLVCTEEALEIRRYWTLQIAEVRYKRGHDYVERFNELFREAVKDRIRTDRAAVYMSGGLDSTLVAAVANQVMGPATGHSGLHACTIVFDRFPGGDAERKYAKLAADFLHIPIEYLVADDYELYTRELEWQYSKPEPINGPLTGLDIDSYRMLTGYTRVALTGTGGDPGLCATDLYIAEYLKPESTWTLLTGIAWCFRIGRRIPRLGLRSLIRKKLGKGPPPYKYSHPGWLNPEFDRRYDLGSRWALWNQPPRPAGDRTGAREELLGAMWQCYFEGLDPGVTRFPIEQRNPFFDVRVAEFMAGVPALPWCQEKNILRAAGQGILPSPVRLRPKAALARSPILDQLRACGPEWWEKQLDPAPELARYVNLDLLPRKPATVSEGGGLRPVSLNYWLKMGRKSRKLRPAHRAV